MKSLLKYIKKYKKEAFLAPLFKLLEACFDLTVPFVIQKMIEIGIYDSNRGKCVTMGLVLLGLAFAGLGFSVVAQYFSAKAAVGFTSDMKRDLFAHIQKFSFSELDEIGTSTLITRMTVDSNQVQNGVNMFLRLFLRSPFIVFGAMILAYVIDWRVGNIFAVTIAVLLVIVFALILVTIPMTKKVQGKMDDCLSLTRENLSGVRVIRAFTREEQEKEEFAARQKNLVGMQQKNGLITSVMNPVSYVILNLGLAYVLIKGNVYVSAGVLAVPQLVALTNYMGQILVELIKFANFCITVTKAIAGGNRIQSIFDRQPSLKNEDCATEIPTDSEYFVEFEKVGFRYTGGGEETLSDISFAVKHGQTVGIIGGTGSGKTTLVSLLAHFYDVTSGRVLLGGRNINEYDKDFLVNKIHIALQKPVLFKGTVASNLKIGKPDASEEDMFRALRMAQATSFIGEKPEDLEKEVEQGGRNFSGGQRQRLGVARALMGDAQLLVLDDSFSALDYATDAALRAELKKLRGEKTMFIISQRTSSVADADMILVLDDGRLVDSGTHDELLQRCELYREIHETQVEAMKGGATA